MKVLVTGASGRLGPFVIRELMDAGHEIVLFSRRHSIEEFRHLPIIVGDVNTFQDCIKAVKFTGGIEAIHHLAAQSWPVDHPDMREKAEKVCLSLDATIQTNILGLYHMLMAGVEARVKIFVMTGSNCVLGHGFRISDRPFPLRYLPIDENHPSDVEDSYSYSKLAGEEMLAAFSHAYGMRTYAVRAAEICDAERRKEITDNARPMTEWNEWMCAWVGSEDVASAHRELMECAYDIEPHGVYFCNSNDTTALESSLKILDQFKPEYLPFVRNLSGHDSFFSNERLRRITGWKHKTSWRKCQE